jgi:hypothetical protein
MTARLGIERLCAVIDSAHIRLVEKSHTPGHPAALSANVAKIRLPV